MLTTSVLPDRVTKPDDFVVRRPSEWRGLPFVSHNRLRISRIAFSAKRLTNTWEKREASPDVGLAVCWVDAEDRRGTPGRLWLSAAGIG